jgi:hypothetical protein
VQVSKSSPSTEKLIRNVPFVDAIDGSAGCEATLSPEAIQGAKVGRFDGWVAKVPG